MKKRLFICKTVKFDAAHRLTNYEGKCRKLHGHTYKVAISISGIPNSNGLVIDFNYLDKFLEKEVLDKVDHAYLNEVLGENNPTVECIVEWVWKTIYKAVQCLKDMNGSIQLEKVRVYETEDSFAEIIKENGI